MLAARTGGLKGAVSVHSWILLKPAGAGEYERWDKVGWGMPVRRNSRAADGRYSVFSNCGRKDRGVDPVAFAARVRDLGAGEILLNDIDRDGMQGGYDLDLIKMVSDAVDIPVVACGGAGRQQHLRDAIAAGAHAAAAGSLFVLIGRLDAVLISYPPQADLEKLYQGLGVFA